MASTLFTIGAEAAKIGYSAYKSRKRKMEAANGTGVNVVPISNHEHRERKGNKTFNKYPSISKRLKNLCSTLTYRWQSWSPYHSKFGSIPMLNITNMDSDGTPAIDATRPLPMYLFDLTSAPNVLGSFKPNTLTNIQSGTLPVANYNPAFRFYMIHKTGSQNAQMPQQLVAVNDLLTQGPNGIMANFTGTADVNRTGNGWQIQYADRISANLISNTSTTTSTFSRGGYVAHSHNAIVHYGNANNTVTPSATQLGIIPPVGSRPLHMRTHVKLCLVGTTNSPTTYDISLIQLKEDWLAPDNIDWTTSRAGAGSGPGVPAKAWGAVTMNQTTPPGGNMGVDVDNTYSGIARKVWMGLAAPYTMGPGVPIDKSIYKYVNIIGKRTVRINAGTSIDNDATGDAHYVDLNFNWNTRRRYDWYSGAEQQELIADVPTDHGGNYNDVGVGFQTKIAASHGNYLTPDPTKRVYLLIRCRTPLQRLVNGSGASTMEADLYKTDGAITQDISGEGVFPNIQQGAASGTLNVPTFDIQITNTFMQDTIDS